MEEKKRIERSIEWLVEEIMRGAIEENRNRKEKELIRRGEFRERTERLVRNLMTEELDRAREEGRRETLLEMQREFSEYEVPDDVRYTHHLFYINNIIEEKLSKLTTK